MTGLTEGIQWRDSMEEFNEGNEGGQQDMLRAKLLELTNQMKKKWTVKQASCRNSENLIYKEKSK